MHTDIQTYIHINFDYQASHQEFGWAQDSMGNNGLGKGGGDNIELLSTYGFKQKYKKYKKYNNSKNDKVQKVQKGKTAQKAHKGTNTIQNI